LTDFNKVRHTTLILHDLPC